MTDITTNLKQSIDSSIAVLDWWRVNQLEYAPLVKGLQDAGYDVILSATGLDVSGSGKKEMLVEAFRILRREGWDTPSRPEEKTNYFSCFFNKEPVKYRLYFSFSSTVCKRVQIGTRYQEVPVYEIQCDGEEENGTL